MLRLTIMSLDFICAFNVVVKCEVILIYGIRWLLEPSLRLIPWLALSCVSTTLR